jgi:hypothetical protein
VVAVVVALGLTEAVVERGVPEDCQPQPVPSLVILDNRGLHLLVVAVEQLFLYLLHKLHPLLVALAGGEVQQVQEANLQ